MARSRFWVYWTTHHDGRISGQLLSSAGAVDDVPSGYGDSKQDVLGQIELVLQEKPALVPTLQWNDELQLRRVRVKVHPQTVVKRRHVIAKEPIELRLSYVFSELGAGGYRVLVPRFGWWFVLEDVDMAAAVIRQAVAIEMLGEHARALYEFREVRDDAIEAWSPSLDRQAARGATAGVDTEVPTLHAVAEDWTEQEGRGRTGSHRSKPIVGDLGLAPTLPLIDRDPPRSLLLVGPSGSGKTTWVRALARWFARSSERSRDRKVWATSADRIVSGMSYLGQWEQRCLELVAELSGEGHLLYVGELGPVCATQTARSSIADMLLPAMVAGEISIITECTPEELERLSSLHPGFVGQLHPVRLEIPPTSVMLRLLTQYQERVGPGLQLEPEALRRLLQHLEFFSRDVSFPGKGFRFLDWLNQEQQTHERPVGDAPPKRLDAAAISEAFARSSGLPLELISDEQAAGRETIAARLREGVIGQNYACEVAARVLTRLKAGLADPARPIGSLFFLGPTGVGKTELAKQLARYMFGDPSKMVRLDMSEYMLPGSAQRLLAVGAGLRSLVEQVRQQPLSLVLLDEIEKAHPEVFDLLLGMLGEGRLADRAGRLVDFRMTLVVMTSNLGVQERESPGFDAGPQRTEELVGAVRRHFRPEFFNRIDHVIGFSRLSPEDLLKIVDLELRKAATRAGLLRRGLRLHVDTAVRERLAELGWHPTRGARPLKRVIEEQLVAPIAARLSADPKLRDAELRVTLDEGGAIRVGSK